ncbi:hypothetical protein TNCT_557171 [Trichonephila clavata]|uniref:Uncharacterized protein n=1 Tax=Trichonephila clavata TaxID=2740835 RepID=A0A8X6FZ69_TRICU|nr:hypothetical protein TNCT_557171 [Trichonephila clavata]
MATDRWSLNQLPQESNFNSISMTISSPRTGSISKCVAYRSRDLSAKGKFLKANLWTTVGVSIGRKRHPFSVENLKHWMQ